MISSPAYTRHSTPRTASIATAPALPQPPRPSPVCPCVGNVCCLSFICYGTPDGAAALRTAVIGAVSPAAVRAPGRADDPPQLGAVPLPTLTRQIPSQKAEPTAALRTAVLGAAPHAAGTHAATGVQYASPATVFYTSLCSVKLRASVRAVCSVLCVVCSVLCTVDAFGAFRRYRHRDRLGHPLRERALLLASDLPLRRSCVPRVAVLCGVRSVDSSRGIAALQWSPVRQTAAVGAPAAVRAPGRADDPPQLCTLPLPTVGRRVRSHSAKPTAALRTAVLGAAPHAARTCAAAEIRPALPTTASHASLCSVLRVLCSVVCGLCSGRFRTVPQGQAQGSAGPPAAGTRAAAGAPTCPFHDCVPSFAVLCDVQKRAAVE